MLRIGAVTVCAFNASYEEALAESRAKQLQQEEALKDCSIPRCELCGDRGGELREFGSPLGYWACNDILACEIRRGKKVPSCNDQEES